MPSRWLIPTIDSQAVARLSAALNIAPLAARVLVRRGFADPAEAHRFLEPSLDDLHDPFRMLGMQPAVDRLRKAIQGGEKILIYGDYDVDGTTSVVLLTKAVQIAGGSAAYHVPHRLKEGYGMRPEVVETAAAQGVTLIISVDTGIRAAEVVARGNQLGIDTIVTDHHLPDTALPPAVAVLNPNQPDCTYPEKNLCGAAVAFKLAHALLSTLGWTDAKLRRVMESFLKMVAIATVADVVPLTGENRIIVKHGLDGLGAVRNPGLRALLDVSGFSDGAIPTSRQIAFQIAPRLNAAGRMDTAQTVIDLFLSSDPARARELARQLHDQNTERQQVEAQIRDLCALIPVDDSTAALVYYGEDWHRGVLGIVASKLVDRFHRPVFVLGRNSEDGLAQGSGRSIPAFHLLEALESMPELFVKFGGHMHAAGVTLDCGRIEEFRERFNAYAARVLRPEDFLPCWDIDAVLELRDIHDRSADGLFALAPFGHGHQPPCFAAFNLEVAAQPTVVKEKHLRAPLRQNGRLLVFKAWNFSERAAEFTPRAHVDAVFQIEPDAYSAARGYPGWSVVLKDLRPAAIECNPGSALH